MSRELTLKAAGLYRDPSPFLAPQGALRVAENVVIRRAGLIEPRPGIASIAPTAPGQGIYVRALFPYAGEMIVAAATDAGAWTYYRSPATAISGVTTPPYSRRPHAVSARKNLYITSAIGMRKLEGGSDTAAVSAGREVLSGECAFTVAGTPLAIAVGNRVSYRWCFVRTDANAYVTRSAPSAYAMVDNTTAGTVNGALTIPIPSDAAASDVIEVYRSASVASPTEPEDAQYLTARHVVTSGDISTGTVALVDSTLPADLGVALYTNGSEEGIEQANEVPPIAADATLFANMVFYGYTTGRHLVFRTLMLVGGSSGTYAGGIKRVATTGITSGGSATLTSVADTSQIRAGMLVVENGKSPTQSGTYIAADTYVVSTTVDTVVMSQSATSSGAITIQFCDVVQCGTKKFYAWSATEKDNRAFLCSSASANVDRVRLTADAMAYVINVATATPKAAHLGLGDMVFESRDLGGSAFTLASSATDAWRDPLDNTGVQSTADTQKNGLAWSKPFEPESVPLQNYQPLGDPLKEVIRLVVSGDALYVFKRDGTWRVTGTNAFDLRFDLVDSTLILIAEDAIATLGDRIYLWTSGGVARLSSGGANIVSQNTIAADIGDRESVNSTFPAVASAYHAWMAASYTSDEVYLGIATAVAFSADIAEQIWVWNEKTSTWVTWRTDGVTSARCGAYNPADDLLWLGSPSAAYDLLKERKVAGSALNNADRGYAITLTSAAGSTVLYDPGASTYSAKAGDAIVQSGAVVSVIVSIVDGTHFVVDDIASVDATGKPATAYRFYTSSVEWVAKTGSEPAAVKHWREGVLRFEDQRGIYMFTLSQQSDATVTANSDTVTRTRAATAAPRALRFLVARPHARSAVLWPKLTVAQACSRWVISALEMRHGEASLRAGRTA